MLIEGEGSPAQLHCPCRDALAGPRRLIGLRRGNDRVLSITDLTCVRSGIVTPVEDRLEVERHRFVARQERDGDGRAGVPPGGWVNKIRLRNVKAMNRDVIVEIATNSVAASSGTAETWSPARSRSISTKCALLARISLAVCEA